MSDNASGSIEGKVTREEMSDVFAVVRTDHAELWERFVDSMRASWAPWTARHPSRIAVMELTAVLSDIDVVRSATPARQSAIKKALLDHLVVLAQDQASDRPSEDMEKAECFLSSTEGLRLIAYIIEAHPDLLRRHQRFRSLGRLAGLDPAYLDFRTELTRVVMGFGPLKHFSTTRISWISRRLLTQEFPVSPSSTEAI